MRWSEQWWYSVPELIRKTEEFYRRNAEAKPGVDLLTVTTQKIIEARRWQPALPFIKNNFAQVLTESKVSYVPRTYEPGALFLFPIRDIDGVYRRAQTNPCVGSTLFGEGKYHWIGEKIAGPNWLGNDSATLARIMKEQYAVLVEGPYDWLACRLIAPEVPVLSPLTKSISEKHEKYLRMLGCKVLYLMFDNERPDTAKGHDLGGGNLSMRVIKSKIKTMEIVIRLLKGGNDPAAALESVWGARALKEILLGDAFLQ